MYSSAEFGPSDYRACTISAAPESMSQNVPKIRSDATVDLECSAPLTGEGTVYESLVWKERGLSLKSCRTLDPVAGTSQPERSPTERRLRDLMLQQAAIACRTVMTVLQLR
jgi:hypothetical protein